MQYSVWHGSTYGAQFHNIRGWWPYLPQRISEVPPLKGATDRIFPDDYLVSLYHRVLTSALDAISSQVIAI